MKGEACSGNKISIARLMRDWRKAAGINTADAGARIGLSGRSIEQIEQGRRRASDELTRIALKKLLADTGQS